ARRLPGLLPAAGHLVHMPAHVYIRTGRYAEASEANRRAIVADRRYVQAVKPEGFYAMYVAHNHQFLWATTMMEGRGAESIRAARDAVAASPIAMLEQMPGLDIVLTYPVLALARFGRWEDVLKEPRPPESFSFATALWWYARGVALAKRGRTDEAAGEKAKLDVVLAKTPADAMELQNTASSLLKIASKALEAQIAAARKQTEASLALWREAVALEDAQRYDEPPDWYYPVRHSLGAALLATGRGAEA